MQEEDINEMKARKLFRKDVNGVNTMHDLCPEFTGGRFIRINRIALRKEPAKSLLVCIYQYDNKRGFKPIDKLTYRAFEEKYVKNGVLISHDLMSTVYVIIQTPKDNGLVLLADDNQINFQAEIRSTDKINYFDIPDFDFEIFYESAA